jgi:succinyl-diaminopimelate desuccinylase
MGGGTYARKIPNAIGFGPGQDRDFSVLGLSEGHGNCHSADEAESVDNIQKAVKIYVNALVKLDQWVGKGMVNNENI